MTTVDMRAASAAREPREFFETSVDIGLALEGDQPPLALAQSEADRVVGRPPQNLETGEGGEPSFAGMRYYHREHSLHYHRDDGTILVYEYEGAMAYALAEIQRSEAPA